MKSIGIKNLRQRMKDEGVINVVVGLSQRVSNTEDRIDKRIAAMEERINKLHVAVLNMTNGLLLTQTQVYDEAQSQLQNMIRSENGLNLVEFETKDVYAVNKRIERLQRDIEEVKNILKYS
jgi:RNase H-fold protein (predicted Holliday junction resolvase)